MNVRCRPCDKFSPADERTIYCRYCGERYPVDIPTLAVQCDELYQRWRKANFKSLMFFSVVPLVLLAGAFLWLINFGATVPPETIKAVVALLPVVFVGMLMVLPVGQLVMLTVLRKKFRAEYPGLFDNPDISL